MLNRDRQRHSGFTLIELMIVVAVVAILAAIAYPNYSRYAFRARRVDGKNLLAQIATAEERFYGVSNAYTNNITGAAPGGLALTNLSEKGYYTATVVLGAGNQTYTLRATPGGIQASDVCGVLSVDNTGLKAPANGLMPQNSNGNCW